MGEIPEQFNRLRCEQCDELMTRLGDRDRRPSTNMICPKMLSFGQLSGQSISIIMLLPASRNST